VAEQHECDEGIFSERPLRLTLNVARAPPIGLYCLRLRRGQVDTGESWAIARAAVSCASATQGASTANREADPLRPVSLSRQRVPESVCRRGVRARTCSDAFAGTDKGRLCWLHRAGAPSARTSTQHCARAWDRLVVASFIARHGAGRTRRGSGRGYVRGPGARNPFPLRT